MGWTSAVDAASLVAELFDPAAARSLTSVPGGLNSEVWRFAVDARRLVLRTSQLPGAFTADEWVWHHFGSSARTAEVLVTGPSDGGGRFAVSVDAGDPITDLTSTLTGKVLRELHRLPVDDLAGWGPVAPPGGERHVSLEAYLSELAAEDATLTRDRWDQDLVDALSGLLAQALDDPASAPRALVHRDLHAGNLLVDAAGRLTLIDWDLAALADPLMDWAVLDMWADGTGAAVPAELIPDTAARRRLWVCEAAHLLGAMRWWAQPECAVHKWHHGVAVGTELVIRARRDL